MIYSILTAGLIAGVSSDPWYGWFGALLALAWLVAAAYVEHRDGRRRHVEAERLRKVQAADRGAPCDFCGGHTAIMTVYRDYDGATLACQACTAVVRGVTC